jgi:hypothetical protein
MKTNPVRRIVAALCSFGITNFVMASGDGDSVVTAVFSRSFNNYARPARADGSDQPLTYVVAKGGAEPGRYGDDSMDDVKFAGIVRVLGKYLAKQSYYPARDGKKADLMLVVHWGKTLPGNDVLNRSMFDQGLQLFASAANGAALSTGASDQMIQGLFEIVFWQDARIEADRHNANLLGYTGELRYRTNPTLYGGLGTAYYDLIDDIESERYYVSVTAYDFQEALQHKTKKGLWRTVASIDARGNRFDERLTAMVERASRYFGRDSGRLIRQFEYIPHINLGELKTLGVVDNPPPSKK